MVELDIGVGSGPTRANAISFGKVQLVFNGVAVIGQ